MSVDETSKQSYTICRRAGQADGEVWIDVPVCGVSFMNQSGWILLDISRIIIILHEFEKLFV